MKQNNETRTIYIETLGTGYNQNSDRNIHDHEKAIGVDNLCLTKLLK